MPEAGDGSARAARLQVASRLAILLPVTSRPRNGGGSVFADTTACTRQLLAGVSCLAASLYPEQHQPTSPHPAEARGTTGHVAEASAASPVDVCFVLGIDEHDRAAAIIVPEMTASLQAAGSGPAVRVHVAVERFSQQSLEQLEPGPICWMWSRLARRAVAEYTPDVLLLLGDDVRMSPQGWPALVMQRFALEPRLMCLLLRDQADPGYPSFPAVRACHLDIFGQMLPDEFTNQGGDPFLAELYRRCGGLGMCSQVEAHNQVGGIQLPDDCGYVPPRYPRRYVPKEAVLQLLDRWAAALQAARPPGPRARAVLTVDVLIPSYCADVDGLERMMELCDRVGRGQAADVRFGLVIDRPSCAAEVRRRLRALQARERWLGRLRLRFNASNLGASGTRNKLLEESLSSHVIFLDDDVTPDPDLVPAYIHAFLAHPEARGFAGPTYLPKLPASLVSCATHLSDVSFFWDAPCSMAKVPWAVTANIAFRNTSTCFDLRFPNTGGGEDIDFCLRACPEGLLAVPGAAARHPLWNGGGLCFLRFAMWAYGDGQLVSMYAGRYTYRAAPNAAELIWALAATQALALLAQPLLAGLPPLAPLRPLASLPWALMALSVAAAECLWDLGRNLLLQERRRRCPCASPAFRAAASAHATAIRLCSESGRIAGHLARGQLAQLGGGRFDWFCGMVPEVVRVEQLSSCGRLAWYTAAMLLACWCWHSP